jgi:hypothetical protein
MRFLLILFFSLNVFAQTKVPMESGVNWGLVASSVSQSQALSNYTTTVDQWGDYRSISLTSGTWSVYGAATFYSNGVTTTTYCNVGMSTTSGNSATGLTFGETYFSESKNTASDSRTTITVPPIFFTFGSTTTVYLKTLCSGSITNLQAAGRITGIRIQ